MNEGFSAFERAPVAWTGFFASDRGRDQKPEAANQDRRGLGTLEFLDVLDPDRAKERRAELFDREISGSQYRLFFQRSGNGRGEIHVLWKKSADKDDGTFVSLYAFSIALDERASRLADNQDLGIEQAAELFGFKLNFRILCDKETGEEMEWRFYAQMDNPDGKEKETYVVTGSFTDHWQNSHSHWELTEDYLLLRGTVTLVRPSKTVEGGLDVDVITALGSGFRHVTMTVKDGAVVRRTEPLIKLEMPNVIFATGEPHNVYLSKDAVIGTAKQEVVGSVPKPPEAQGDWKREAGFEAALLTDENVALVVAENETAKTADGVNY